MRTLTPLDLRQRLGQILDAASAGERFVVERNHRPLAMLVSVEDGRRLDEDASEVRRRRLAALDRLAELGREWAERYPSTLTAAEEVRLDRDRDEPGVEGDHRA
jgi:prevent-host-death family protein